MLQYEVGVTASESYKIYSINTEYYELMEDKAETLA